MLLYCNVLYLNCTVAHKGHALTTLKSRTIVLETGLLHRNRPSPQKKACSVDLGLLQLCTNGPASVEISLLRRNRPAPYKQACSVKIGLLRRNKSCSVETELLCRNRTAPQKQNCSVETELLRRNEPCFSVSSHRSWFYKSI